MRLLVNGATLTVERFRHSPFLGALLTPLCKNSPSRVCSWGLPFALDNGATGQDGFDAGLFRHLLKKVQPHAAHCLFAAAPDVVRRVGKHDFLGDARATVGQLAEWSEVIAAHGLPVALVGQDGLEDLGVPWELIDAFFVGGSTQWKLSPAARALCHEARRRGKHVHVGRVNSLRRIRASFAMGADSIDGSHFTWWPDAHIPVGLRWIEQTVRQQLIWPPPPKVTNNPNQGTRP